MQVKWVQNEKVPNKWGTVIDFKDRVKSESHVKQNSSWDI